MPRRWYALGDFTSRASRQPPFIRTTRNHREKASLPNQQCVCLGTLRHSAILTASRERVPASYVSASVFTVVGERPLLGRVFTTADDQRGAPAVIILGEGVWQERYGGDPYIVGRSVTVDDEAVTVIGVMPARFRFPLIDKAWLPLAMAPQAHDRKRDERTLAVVGRMAQGVSVPQARAELDAIAARLAREYPDTDAALHRINLAELPAVRRTFVRGRFTRGHGSGLGLSIVRRIVADHHGWFTLESELGAGTVATVGLPVAGDEG